MYFTLEYGIMVVKESRFSLSPSKADLREAKERPRPKRQDRPQQLELKPKDGDSRGFKHFRKKYQIVLMNQNNQSTCHPEIGTSGLLMGDTHGLVLSDGVFNLLILW
jgi:hypothetical protein